MSDMCDEEPSLVEQYGYDPTIKCKRIGGNGHVSYCTAKGNFEYLLKGIRGNPKLSPAAKAALLPFAALACRIVDNYPPSAERSTAVRRIKEAKDCLVLDTIPDVVDAE